MTGLTINVTFDSSVTSAANASQIEAGVNAEVSVLENLIATPLTVNLNVGWGEVGGTTMAAGDLEDRSADQSVSISQQQVYSALRPRVFNTEGFDSQNAISVPLGSAMALGLAANAPINAAIGFSSTANWDFSGGPTIAPGAYDFQGSVAHEITQVLGRVADPNGSPWLSEFYRFIGPGNPVDGGLDYAGLYFSVDNGYSRGPTYQTDSADWTEASSGPDAFANPIAGAQLVISQTDLNDLRALGFDLKNSTDYSAAITTNYENYFGRAPTPSELGVWQGFIHDDADIVTLQTRLGADPVFRQHVFDTAYFLDGYYSDQGFYAYFDEPLFTAAVAAGNTSEIRAQVISTPAGQAYVARVVTGLYDIYFGRDPTSSELATWQASILAGDGYDAVRATLVASNEGHGHTVEAIDELYQQYLGRLPTGTELSNWETQIANGVPGAYYQAGVHDFVGIYSALVASPEGQAHATPIITQIYDTYMGRDPTPEELSNWETYSLEWTAHVAPDITAGPNDTFYGHNPQVTNRLAGTNYIPQGSLLDEYSSVRIAILNDQYGYQHTVTETTSLYDTYFGRDPTSDELNTWNTSLINGATFDQMQDTLERQSTAPNVQHLVASSDPQAFAYGAGAAGQYMTIDQFDPAHDTVSLSNSTYGGINPLDASHARQITALDGTTDVLVTLDPTHSILFEHTTLASLQANDFVFN